MEDQPKKRRFKFFKPSELRVLPKREMLIDGLLGVRDIWMLFGRPGAAKSFCAIDLLVCCAVGGTWAGQFDCARPLKVIYCAGEGQSGVASRISACLQQYEIDWDDIEANFRMVAEVPQALDEQSEESLFVLLSETIEDGFRPDIIIIDTLHMASDGAKENDNDDSRRAVKLLKKATKAFSCSIGLVHHSGHGSDHPRGASGYLGAADLVLRMDLDDDTKTGFLVLYKGKEIRPWAKTPLSVISLDASAVINFKPGTDPEADTTLAKILGTMLSKPAQQWWTPTELALQIDGMRDKAETIRKSCFRDSKKGDDSALIWDGNTRPAHYRRRGTC